MSRAERMSLSRAAIVTASFARETLSCRGSGRVDANPVRKSVNSAAHPHVSLRTREGSLRRGVRTTHQEEVHMLRSSGEATLPDLRHAPRTLRREPARRVIRGLVGFCRQHQRASLVTVSQADAAKAHGRWADDIEHAYQDR